MVTERIDIRVTQSGARTVSRDIDSIGGAAAGAGTLVKQLKGLLIGLGAGIALSSVVSTLADFGQEMSTVRAITSATEEQYHDLREETRRLGAETRFSASQAAEGAVFLARAGFNTDQILVSLNDTLRLAQAGALDLGSAADIASNILTGFRLQAGDAAHVVDVLAKAANSSNTDVRQLGDGMKYVAPVAAGMKVSLEETTSAIGALSNAGLQGSMAGTGLRRVLSELESPSIKTAKILRSLKVDLNEVRITQVGLTAAMQRLRQAGVDTGLALEIFGDRGGPAFEVLSESLPFVERMNAALSDSEGFAKRVADTMDDNLNGALLAAKSALEALVISFGDLGADSALTQFFRGLATVLRTIANNLGDIAIAAKIVGSVLLAVYGPALLASALGFLNGQLSAIHATQELNAAVSSGRAVLLGSAAAEAARGGAAAEASSTPLK